MTAVFARVCSVSACRCFMCSCTEIADWCDCFAGFACMSVTAALCAAQRLDPVANWACTVSYDNCALVVENSVSDIWTGLEDSAAEILGFVCVKYFECTCFDGVLEKFVVFDDVVPQVFIEVDMCWYVGHCHSGEEWSAATGI